MQEVTLPQTQEREGHASKYYSILVTHSTESTLNKLNAWKIDKKDDIDEIGWDKAGLKAQKQTINTRFKLLQYKWLRRTYITVKLHYMSSYIPDVRSKCVDEKETIPLLMGMFKDPGFLEGSYKMFFRDV